MSVKKLRVSATFIHKKHDTKIIKKTQPILFQRKKNHGTNPTHERRVSNERDANPYNDLESVHASD